MYQVLTDFIGILFLIIFLKAILGDEYHPSIYLSIYLCDVKKQTSSFLIPEFKQMWTILQLTYWLQNVNSNTRALLDTPFCRQGYIILSFRGTVVGEGNRRVKCHKFGMCKP
jgi:hypothetical protein